METQHDRPGVMTVRGRGYRWCVTLAAALLGAATFAGVTTPAAAAAVTPSSCPAPQPLTAAVPVLVRPVVLVHGWTGKLMVDTAHALLAEPSLPIATYLFDYSHWSAHWVTDQHIAACLADYVRAVSDAYRRAGGDGRVIVVAHSMGGLAIRYATSARYVANPVTSAQLGAVITFDTPELGSPFGNTWGGRLWETIQSHTSGIDLPPPGPGDGQRCLAQHDHGQPLPNGCGQDASDTPDPPPWLPAGVPLTEIAGDITVDRSLFGVHLYSVPLSSDGIVTTASSHGYPTSGPGGQLQRGAGAVRDTTDACTTSANDIEKAFFSWIGQVTSEASPVGAGLLALSVGFTDYLTAQAVQRGDVTDPLVEAYFLGAALSARCSHRKVATDQSAVNQATESIRTALTQLSGAAQPQTATTKVVTVVPVDRNGKPASGYKVVDDGGSVDCGSPTYPSPAAVTPGIVYCAPTAADADICWPEPDHLTLLCGLYPWDGQLHRNTASAPVTSVTPVADPQPWALQLADGTRCRIRNGGSWSGRSDGLVGAYSCIGTDYVVLSRTDPVPETIDKTKPQWTVQVGVLDDRQTGSPPPRTEAVHVAYFAGAP